MTRVFIFILLGTIYFGCSGGKTETVTIKIEGKPVNVTHTFGLKRGSLRWSYKGEVNGKVGVCISGCQPVSEDHYTSTCNPSQILSGKFNVPQPYVGQEEGVEKGTHRCFVLIPEKGTTGVVHITFLESRLGSW